MILKVVKHNQWVVYKLFSCTCNPIGQIPLNHIQKSQEVVMLIVLSNQLKQHYAQ